MLGLLGFSPDDFGSRKSVLLKSPEHQETKTVTPASKTTNSQTVEEMLVNAAQVDQLRDDHHGPFGF